MSQVLRVSIHGTLDESLLVAQVQVNVETHPLSSLVWIWRCTREKLEGEGWLVGVKSKLGGQGDVRIGEWLFLIVSFYSSACLDIFSWFLCRCPIPLVNQQHCVWSLCLKIAPFLTTRKQTSPSTERDHIILELNGRWEILFVIWCCRRLPTVGIILANLCDWIINLLSISSYSHQFVLVLLHFLV